MAGRALLPIGRDDGDLANLLGRLHEHLQTGRENSVVVGAEQPHA
jgi:hypothetical protein